MLKLLSSCAFLLAAVNLPAALPASLPSTTVEANQGQFGLRYQFLARRGTSSTALSPLHAGIALPGSSVRLKWVGANSGAPATVLRQQLAPNGDSLAQVDGHTGLFQRPALHHLVQSAKRPVSATYEIPGESVGFRTAAPRDNNISNLGDPFHCPFSTPGVQHLKRDAERQEAKDACREATEAAKSRRETNATVLFNGIAITGEAPRPPARTAAQFSTDHTQPQEKLP